jgi:Kef-type K+ transport system membrane component KefB
MKPWGCPLVRRQLSIYSLAALWLGLALVVTLLSIWLRIATAMSEIIVGIVAQPWIKFLASTGAVVLTFLAGAELDPQVMRRQWKQATIVGLVAFTAPFLGCAAVARFLIGWSADASWLAGIALSTTSVAVVYAVMLEFGLSQAASDSRKKVGDSRSGPALPGTPIPGRRWQRLSVQRQISRVA